MSWVYWILLIVGGIVVVGVVMRIVFRAMHHAVLLAKFGDAAAAEKIIDGKIWQGMTAAQLTEVMGTPLKVDQRVLKTKTVEIWKYGEITKNQFQWRITLEDGVVTVWEQK